MRKIPAILFTACAATFALSACNQQEQPKDQAAQAAPQVAAKPTNPADKTAWKQYLVSVVTANMQGVKSNRPYMYFVPGGEDEAAVADRANQFENVHNTVLRGVLPGNMMAFGGPDSKRTADLIVESSKAAQDGALKGVVVLFIGTSADSDRVKEALAKSGADYRFVEMK